MEPDFIATELLKELKESNARKDQQITQLHKNQMYMFFSFLIVILFIVAGFLLYLNQYDFSSSDEYTYEATGTYALVDSAGNIIAQDLTPEDIMEVINSNGYGEENYQENSNED